MKTAVTMYSLILSTLGQVGRTSLRPHRTPTYWPMVRYPGISLGGAREGDMGAHAYSIARRAASGTYTNRCYGHSLEPNAAARATIHGPLRACAHMLRAHGIWYVPLN